MKVRTKNIIFLILLILLALFSFLMLRIIWRYSSLETGVGFLQLKQDYIHISPWMAAFWIHVFSSILVLLAGFTQFSKLLLRKYPKLHRALGYIYVLDVLFITGPAGMLMSFYANGGIFSRIGFTLLSGLWISSTTLAWYYAVKRKFDKHRIFMIRSFALTLSAISLRLWKMFFAAFTDVPPMDRYRIIAWLGWVLNLIIAEYIIYHYYRRKSFDRKGGKALKTI